MWETLMRSESLIYTRTTACPRCGAAIEFGCDGWPKAGDAIQCDECSKYNIFLDDLSLRELNLEETLIICCASIDKSVAILREGRYATEREQGGRAIVDEYNRRRR